MDVWAFGLLLYESLIQEPKLFRSNLNHDNDEFMLELSQWSLQNVENISIQQQQNKNESTEERKELSSSFLLVVTDLICQCLAPDPENRPRDFETILKHKFWQLF